MTLVDGDESQGERDKLLFTPASATFTGSLVFNYTVENASGTQDTASVQLVVQPSVYGNASTELPEIGSTTLSLGFAVGPNSSFSTSSQGSYSFSTSGTSAVSSSFTGDDGVSYSQLDDLTRTLNVSRVVNSDGSWTYTESFVGILGTGIDPTAGANTGGTTKEVDTDYSYTFIATGSGNIVSYTFVTSSTVVDDGLESSSWNNTNSETGFSNSGTKTNDYLKTTTATSTVTNTTNTSTGVSTGSVSGSGGTSDGYSYGGDYSYDISGGTISGTYFELGSEGTTWNFSGATKTETYWSNDALSYSGSGSYNVGAGASSTSSGSGVASTWSISGTIQESGSNGGSSSYTYTFDQQSDGTWLKTAASGGGFHAERVDSSYSGSGSYSLGSISGTTKESGTSHWDYHYNWGETQNIATGAWSLTSGSGGSTDKAKNDFSYSGSGGYSINGFSGTEKESGSDHSDYNYGTVSNADGGAWQTSGSGSYTERSKNDWSYSGSGSYVRSSDDITLGSGGSTGSTYGGAGASGGSATDGWMMFGTVWESGSKGGDSHSTVYSTLGSDGEWSISSGSGGGTSKKTSDWSYSGGGFYSLGVNGGTTKESGSQHTDYNYGWSNTLDVAADEWNLTSGSGGSTEKGKSEFSYSGSGSYSINGISGTEKESGTNHSDYNYGTTSTVGSGAWQDSGSGSYTQRSKNDWSYSGSGGYSLGAFTGTIKESGSNGGDSHSTVYSTLGSDDKWHTSSGSGGGSSKGKSHWSYSGSGGYSIGGVSGTMNVAGTSHSDYGYNWDQELDVAASKWNLTSGSGGSSQTASDDFSYSGSGRYSYAVTGGSVGGTIKEGGNDHWDYNYGTTATVSSGHWNDSGSGSYNENGGFNWGYSGSGSYSQNGVSGTIKESGSEGSSYHYTEKSDLVLGSIWALSSVTGGGSVNNSNDWSYSGSGSFSYGVSGGSVSGTIKESGAEGSGSNYSWEAEKNLTTGNWSLTSGSGGSHATGSMNWSYSGSGGYSYGVTGGSVSGTIQDSGSENWNYGYGTTSIVSGNAWQTSGSGGGGGGGFSEYSYSGSGSYARSVGVMTVSGTVTEGGNNGWNYSYGTQSTLATGAASWATSGSGTQSTHAQSSYGYSGSGSGSYSSTTTSANGSSTNSGNQSLSENGNQSGSAYTSANWVYTNGWVMTESSRSGGSENGGGYVWHTDSSGTSDYTDGDSNNGSHSHSETSGSVDITENYHNTTGYDYATTYGGSPTETGSSWGSSTSDGSATYVSDGTWTYDTWSNGGGTSRTDHMGSTSHMNSNDTYDYSYAWNTPAGSASSSGSSSASGTNHVTGSMTMTMGSDWSWTESTTGSSSSSGSGSGSGGGGGSSSSSSGSSTWTSSSSYNETVNYGGWYSGAFHPGGAGIAGGPSRVAGTTSSGATTTSGSGSGSGGTAAGATYQNTGDGSATSGSNSSNASNSGYMLTSFSPDPPSDGQSQAGDEPKKRKGAHGEGKEHSGLNKGKHQAADTRGIAEQARGDENAPANNNPSGERTERSAARAEGERKYAASVKEKKKELNNPDLAKERELERLKALDAAKKAAKEEVQEAMSKANELSKAGQSVDAQNLRKSAVELGRQADASTDGAELAAETGKFARMRKGIKVLGYLGVVGDVIDILSLPTRAWWQEKSLLEVWEDDVEAEIKSLEEKPAIIISPGWIGINPVDQFGLRSGGSFPGGA